MKPNINIIVRNDNNNGFDLDQINNLWFYTPTISGGPSDSAIAEITTEFDRPDQDSCSGLIRVNQWDIEGRVQTTFKFIGLRIGEEIFVKIRDIKLVGHENLSC